MHRLIHFTHEILPLPVGTELQGEADPGSLLPVNSRPLVQVMADLYGRCGSGEGMAVPL